jgi:hypothetical protein
MAHMRITIDGETVMDDTLDAWSAEPPKILRDQLAANSTPKLFMRCLLLVLADSAVTQTAHRATGAANRCGATQPGTGTTTPNRPAAASSKATTEP